MTLDKAQDFTPPPFQNIQAAVCAFLQDAILNLP